MRDELREKILAYKKETAECRRTAADLMELLGKIPPGIMRQIARDEEREAILVKYGFQQKEE